MINNTSEVLLGARIHRPGPGAPIAIAILPRRKSALSQYSLATVHSCADTYYAFIVTISARAHRWPALYCDNAILRHRNIAIAIGAPGPKCAPARQERKLKGKTPNR